MRRDIYQEFSTWVPADSNDLNWYSRPVPDDMILEIRQPTVYLPTLSATRIFLIGIDNHGQFIPVGAQNITNGYYATFIQVWVIPFFLYEHQRLQYKWLVVESGETYHYAIHGILYDADEWRRGKD